jgi:hypothetical protein
MEANVKCVVQLAQRVRCKVCDIFGFEYRGDRRRHMGWEGQSIGRNADSVTVDFLVNMSASADVLAMAKVEVDLAAIPEGKNVSLPLN